MYCSTVCIQKKLFVRKVCVYGTHRSSQQSFRQGFIQKSHPSPSMVLLIKLRHLFVGHCYGGRLFATSAHLPPPPPGPRTLLQIFVGRYSGMNREAGRSLLESLCLQKHHLKVFCAPSHSILYQSEK